LSTLDDKAKHPYRRLLGYLKPHKGIFALSILGFLIFSATQPALAHMLEYVVDALENGDENAKYLIPGAIFGIFIVRGIGTFIGNYFMSKVGFSIVRTLRTAIFNHLTIMPSAYFDQYSSGTLISKITYDVSQVTKSITNALTVVIREGTTAFFLVGYLVWQNWKLTLVFLFVAPFLAVIVSWASKRMRKLSSRIQDSMGNITHTASEMIGNYRVMRSFGGEEYERKRFLDAANNNFRQNLKLVTTSSISTPMTQMIVVTALCVLMYLGLAFTTTMGEGAGSFVAYLAAATQVPGAVRKLVEVNNTIQKGIAAAESVFAQLDAVPEADAGQTRVERVTGTIKLESVAFRYSASDKNVINDISLAINPGQVVALVGRSGSGKTTLAALIQRFYDHQSGNILIDDIPVQDFELINLRQQIALVNQNVDLFNDTVANNIAYGDMQGSSADAIEHAARLANAWEFIEQMPDGLDTLIGEDGARLSGGQRQRLAIARALLKDAPILILDEATSALDTESEQKIQIALEQAMKNRTTIVIAHRLSTIENADQIVVMDRGAIVEQGTHTELLAAQGTYAQLHARNFTDDESDKTVVG